MCAAGEETDSRIERIDMVRDSIATPVPLRAGARERAKVETLLVSRSGSGEVMGEMGLSEREKGALRVGGQAFIGEHRPHGYCRGPCT